MIRMVAVETVTSLSWLSADINSNVTLCKMDGMVCHNNIKP